MGGENLGKPNENSKGPMRPVLRALGAAAALVGSVVSPVPPVEASRGSYAIHDATDTEHVARDAQRRDEVRERVLRDGLTVNDIEEYGDLILEMQQKLGDLKSQDTASRMEGRAVMLDFFSRFGEMQKFVASVHALRHQQPHQTEHALKAIEGNSVEDADVRMQYEHAVRLLSQVFITSGHVLLEYPNTFTFQRRFIFGRESDGVFARGKVESATRAIEEFLVLPEGVRVRAVFHAIQESERVPESPPAPIRERAGEMREAGL